MDGDLPAQFRLDRRVAFITGGTKNIGRAIARTFVRAGADVIITARTEADLVDVASELREMGGRVLTVVGDVGDEGAVTRSVTAALDVFGGVDILVNNAFSKGGPVRRERALDTSADDWDAVWRTNVMGPYRYIQLLEPVMRDRGRGSIVNLLSIIAYRYANGLAAYATTKSALWTLTRYMATELGPTIRVNAIAPGAVSPTGEPRNFVQEQIAKVAPMQRIGSPDEIASAALFLASDASSFVTGQVIVVDGGVVGKGI
jgi:NAD(P)-dependent dehydrogenase (short-subunit alcohol dehydrogenase family)